MFEPRIHDPYGLYPTAPWVSHCYELVDDGYPKDVELFTVWECTSVRTGDDRFRVRTVTRDGVEVQPGPVVHRYAGATLHHGAASPFDAIRTSPIMTRDPLQDPREDIAGAVD